MGHFNSRTRKYSDTVSHEGNSIIIHGQSDSAFQPAQRNSFDNILNNNGKKLLEICKKLDLRIVNSRLITIYGGNETLRNAYTFDANKLANVRGDIIKNNRLIDIEF